MSDAAQIDLYHARLSEGDLAIAARLRGEIDTMLPDAQSKVWHGHPVWFLDGNPVAGYASRKDGMVLLFWSGQGFAEPGLRATGKFKAAEARYAGAAEIDLAKLRRWLQQAREVQWDYKNIVKRKGVLERLD